MIQNGSVQIAVTDGEKEMMTREDRVCCICNEKKKFLGRINVSAKYYCIQCQAKITREYGSSYWNPCSFEEFFENIVRLKKEK